MKKHVLLSIIFVITISLLTVQAQPPKQDNPHQRPDRPAREMKKFIAENVIPLLKIQRQELDKSLSKQEIQRLEEIRSEMKKLRNEQRTQRQEIEKNGQKPSVEQKQNMRANRNQMNSLMDELEIMAENHDAQITALLDQIKPEIESAHHEMKLIMEKQERPEHNMKNHHGNLHQNKFKPEAENRPLSPIHRLLTPEGFLLWNPAEPHPDLEEFSDQTRSQKIIIFPNPAENQVQISLNLDSPANVEINLFDKDGNNIKSFPAEKANNGIFSKTININDLENGLYLIKVKAGNFESIERVIIDK